MAGRHINLNLKSTGIESVQKFLTLEWHDRAAKGSWRKSGDRPVGVDWNERVINIHEGGWNYVVNGVGIAPGIILRLFSRSP